MTRWGLLLTAALLFAVRPAHAAPRRAAFAVVIGVNHAVERDLPTLRYADDDAVAYAHLFRLLGARTHVLARLDENTLRLHPEAAKATLPPTRASLAKVERQLAGEVKSAKRHGQSTTLYLVYAGHGAVHHGKAYVLLEDDRLDAARLSAFIKQVGVDRAHVIVDACDSGLLAASRGPGGRRRPYAGFSHMGPLFDSHRVGLLLSTSSGRESHEWQAYQAGVFSDEVRSGLYGAADADHDGRITYREIAAFVSRANAAIPNERFRPNVFARPPAGSSVLVDLRPAVARRIHIGHARSAHWVLENAKGVRLADFHPRPDGDVSVLRPDDGALFLQRVGATGNGVEKEYAIPAGRTAVDLDELQSERPRVAMRGAANEALRLLFTLPFGEADVKSYRFPPPVPCTPVSGAPDRAPHEAAWRRPTGTILLGVGAAAAVTGGALVLSAANTRSGAGTLSQRDIAAENARIADRNLGAKISFGVAGAAVVSGLAVLFWPSGSGTISASVGPGGAGITYAHPLAF